MEGVVSVKGQVTDKWVVMEPPSHSSVPGGLLVASCLLDLPKHPSRKVSVVLKNETDHDITIPGKSVIAEVHAIQRVISSKSTPKGDVSSNGEERSTKELCFDFDDSPLTTEWKERISQKLRDMSEVFAMHDFDVGRTDKVKHSIKLHDNTPFKHRARPIHPDDFEAVRRHLEELLEAGIIRESESSFSSPIVVVKKKNGDVRLCIDYRKLNTQTIKDAYALPNLEEAFSALRGAKWFSVLDLKSGYYQIEVEEKDKHKTAFVCPLGFWEFNRMPQGITNAPSTFQRLMEKCMGDINLTEVLVFLDDLIIFSETLEEHEIRLLHVLNRLKEYGLKLSVEKCKFLQTSVRYLGHVVSQNGVETDPQKIETIKTWPSPKTLKELRSFLGFSGYYRRFIRDYSKIAKPLNDLTVGYPPLRKNCKGKSKITSYLSPKVPFGGRWTERKSNLDADGLSRRPHGMLTNDMISQKEQERIRQFTLHHLPEEGNSVLVSSDVVQAINDKHLVRTAEDDDYIPLIESLSVSSEAIPETYGCFEGFPVVPQMTEKELKDEQRADPAIQEVVLQLESGKPSLPVLRKELPELPFFLREWKKLELKDGILYRKRVVGEHTTYQLVLPKNLRPLVLEQLHDNMGHMGMERTLDLARTRFYWPRMATDVEVKIKTCNRCVCRKTPPERAAPLVNIQVSRPLELVCMDFLSLEPDRSNTKDILVITDYFTKYAVAVPTSNQKAKTVAKSLWENFFVHYGIPERLHSDQGPDFESKTIKELCEIAGIRKVRTTPYHPRGNPVERFNRTLLSMLGTLGNKDKTHWRDFVKPVVHAYNCTKHETTGFTPYELMFGRQPRLPIDLAFRAPVSNSHNEFHSQYVKTLKTHLQESYELARKNAAKVAARNKTRFFESETGVKKKPVKLGIWSGLLLH
ncbi:interleukin-1 receptor accessory protein-like 1-A [Pimephales promelas]|nr:interleukin-1 receptor accessory protein-like 1-A [Pimephales promelas]